MTLTFPRLRRFVGLAGIAAAFAATGCTPRPLAPAEPAAPRYPGYVFPVVPEEFGGPDLATAHREAWQQLQAGDLAASERAFSALLGSNPDFYPSETGLGYVDLAGGEYESALGRFDDVLSRHPAYAPALAGRGETLLATDRPEDALAAFEAAVAADPALGDIRQRVDVLRFRAQEAIVARARADAEHGLLTQAEVAYGRAIASSPESPFLYRELADVERRLGRLDRALSNARKAVELDAGDPRAYTTLAEVEVAKEDYDAALSALARASELDPSDAIRRRIDEVREAALLATLPPEFRAIPQQAALSRGALAALIAVRLKALLQQAPQREGVFITDTRDHWAASWILEVARAGVMEAYPNYTFLPDAPVQRGELATVVSRLLALVARSHPALAEKWREAHVSFTDLSPAHLSYPAASLAVAAGVLPVLDGGTFQLTRVVSGAEAVAAVQQVQRLAGLEAP
jgi:tetratricopeptide (TPR) repeat protein